MKTRSWIGIMALLLLFFSCEKKKLELDVIEARCKKFAIEVTEASFDGSVCDTKPGDTSVRVTFTYDGDQECIHVVKFDDVSFIDSNENEMTDRVQFDTEIFADDPGQLTVNDNGTATFNFCYGFNNVSDTGSLSMIFLNFHTENEIGNSSESTGLLITIPGRTLNPRVDEIETTYVTNQSFIEIDVWDDAAEDGDIVAFNLNGEWIYTNFLTRNAKTRILIPLDVGENILVMYAVNLGSSPPNTAAIHIDPEFTEEETAFEIRLDFEQKNSGAIRLIRQ
jgi:hypothetical protein